MKKKKPVKHRHPWTPELLKKFDELTMMLSSQHQMTRHEGRFAVKKFEAEHGTELCQKMFEYLQARDKKRGTFG